MRRMNIDTIFTLRMQYRVGQLARIATAIAEAGALVGEIVIRRVGDEHTIRDITVETADEAHTIAVAAKIAALSPHTPVACAYLELSTPDLATAVAALVARQVRSVRIVPLFLGVGRHAREDLPVLVTELRETYPDIAFTLNKAVGEEDRLVQLLAQIAVESL